MLQHRRRTTWRTRLGFAAALLGGLLLFGVLLDLTWGFALLRSARSWTAWLLGLGVVVVVYAAGELGAGWLHSRDRVTDPPWWRAAHFFTLIAFSGLIALLLWLIFQLVT
jgi:hypothetical protein